MLQQALWHVLQESVFDVPSEEGLFNPYRDRHPELDLPDAPAIRRENLRRYLGCFEAPPPVLLLAEAPGPWGCRFSGVPFTSEAQLTDDAFPVDGRPSSVGEAPHAEYSGGIYWRVLAPFFPSFFTWNSVPLHPHKPGKPLTIRAPRVSEIRAFAPVVAAMVDVLRPAHVLAVGRKAERTLAELGIAATYVRHPSQGGARIFEETVTAYMDAAGLRPNGA